MTTIKEFVDNAKEQKLYYAVLKNWHHPVPSWEDFEEVIDPKSNGVRKFIKDVPLKEEMQYFLDESKKAYPDIEYQYYIFEGKRYRNLDINWPGEPLHKDPYDILHWHCKGVTEWQIGLYAEMNGTPKQFEYEERKGWDWHTAWTKEPQTIMLEPGDLLWLRKATWHRTQNLAEKYSIIFDAGPLWE